MPAPYASTATTIVNSVVAKLRLDAVADAAKTLEWVNQVYTNVATTTRYYSGSSAGAALTAAATSQALPTTIVELEYATATYGGQSLVMMLVDFDRLLQMRQGQSGASGPPLFYSLRKGTVEFFPAAAGGEIITYYGATIPNAMVLGDIPDLPEPFASKLLEYGACVEAADFKNDARLYFWYQQAYGTWMGQFIAFLNQRKTQAGRAFPIQGPDGRPFTSPFVPHDPSSDWYVTGFRS